LTHPTNVGVVTTLNPHTGRIVNQWPIPPPTSRPRDGGVWSASGLALGNGGGYLGDDNNGRLLRLTPPHGLQVLHGPKAAQLTAVTSHTLWAINRNGQLLRIALARR
jgi:hypothetical protein